MGKWLVIDTSVVVQHGYDRNECREVFATTSEDRASAWIGTKGDPVKAHEGLYHIDECPMNGKEHAAWIEQVASELGISLQWEFVPWSQSRNKGEKDPSLNYKVTLTRRQGSTGPDRPILTTDYGMGCGHAPSYKATFGRVNKYEDDCRKERVLKECETGYAHGRYNEALGGPIKTGRMQIAPKLADVLYSLASDAGVLDCASFEDWASDLGFDPDSRSAEKTYQACLAIALKLRNGIGEDGLAQLREACEGY